MERRDELLRRGCSIAKQTILTTHPSGLQTRVSVELANFDSLCLHSECKTPKRSGMWESPFLNRRMLGSAHATPVLGRRSDVINEGRLSQQCSPVMRRREVESPGGSPLLGRRETEESDVDSVISGWLKFRDNKRWKTRWGVVTKLSPAADCLHLQLYREAGDRWRRGQSKASLALQHFLGFESGFTLDNESNTLAVLCRDLVLVLAFHTRESLISWQVKVGSQLGSSQQFLVLVAAGSRHLPAGPARLHVRPARAALAAGTPPRLLGLWELRHLRRYGVVDGRFCFEGGAHCGAGAGLHVLVAERADDIAAAFTAAAAPAAPAARSDADRSSKSRPSTRLSDFNSVDQSLPDSADGLYEENFFGEDCGVSPFWPSDERRDYEDFRRSDEAGQPPWTVADRVTLERCSDCQARLGAAPRPAAAFSPAWTMEPAPGGGSDASSDNAEYLTPRMIKKSLEAHRCDEAPQRPPKPGQREQRQTEGVTLTQCSSCGTNDNIRPTNNPKVGPYENYDVPKATYAERMDPGEHYDTPKRIKQALVDDLFQVTKSSSPGSLVLKKNCGCILKFASQNKPVIVECEESLQPAECPCQKVTSWANNLISLPYCKRESTDKARTEFSNGDKSEDMALYATVDVSRKTKRQSGCTDKDDSHEPVDVTPFTNYQNIDPKNNQGPESSYSNYENLEFALSLEYYENAKDLLKKAGVTQSELDALSININLASKSLPKKTRLCTKCGHFQDQHKQDVKNIKCDEYLLMQPTKEVRHDRCQTVAPNPGYTPMSPNPNWSQSLKHPTQKLYKIDIEKSVSIPALNGSTGMRNSDEVQSALNQNSDIVQKRSSSVDSGRLLEDLKEFDNSISSHATSSSLETLRNMTIENRRSSSPCENERECSDCCKSSGSENKTSESSEREVPHLRNKLMDNAQITRSSSVPCKGANRDSSSSNDSGVSSCSVKHAGDFNEFEMPLTSGQSRHQFMLYRKMRGSGCVHSSLPRKSKSSDPLRDQSMQLSKNTAHVKSSSAEAEVPVLPPKQFKGVGDSRSTSSGTSDMSDYIETLSTTSSHSSGSPPAACVTRARRQPTSMLRPRSGKEYFNVDPSLAGRYRDAGAATTRAREPRDAASAPASYLYTTHTTVESRLDRDL